LHRTSGYIALRSGDGIGRERDEEGVKRTEAHYAGQGIRISAQAYLEKFYGEFGFRTVRRSLRRGRHPTSRDAVLARERIASFRRYDCGIGINPASGLVNHGDLRP